MAKHNPRRSNGHRRNKLRARVLAEEEVCGICRRWVDQDLPPRHPLAAEIDEIIPVSKGGSPYDRANCRLVHRRCNQLRGNGDRRPSRRLVPTFIVGRP